MVSGILAVYVYRDKLTVFNPKGMLESKSGIKSQYYEDRHDWNAETLCDEIDSMQDIRWVLDTHDGLEVEVPLPLQ